MFQLWRQSCSAPDPSAFKAGEESRVNGTRAQTRRLRPDCRLAFIDDAASLPNTAGVLYPAFSILLNQSSPLPPSRYRQCVVGDALRLSRVRLSRILKTPLGVIPGRAAGANPESRCAICVCFWIPGPTLRVVPE
jgi:hypothetical protein